MLNLSNLKGKGEKFTIRRTGANTVFEEVLPGEFRYKLLPRVKNNWGRR